MPVYEYLCQACGKQFEELQKISDNPLKECKFCGGPVQKAISQTSFSLKGGGWYKDGYSSPKPDSGSKPSAAETKDKASSPAKVSDPPSRPS